MKPGDRLAHYELMGPIGSGGMGEVYLARDTKLDREVALKILPDNFASDPERLARFRREAKVLAALNHTNIAAIHGLEEDGVKLVLAMELAPGQTLEARIEQGPMPVEECLKVAVQIAAGLEEAYEKGIVHRDLKPANVKLGPDGQVKILDFGLARAYEGEVETEGDSNNSPTLTAAMTQAGVILGTAAYMSPEQARGHKVDSRTDVWAFGVILFELLAGRRQFAGETVSDTLAMVLRSEPDWVALPTDLPPSFRRLLKRCLQRDRRQRLHHIADARIVMEEILLDGTSAHEPALTGSFPMTAAQKRSGRAGWIAAAVLAVAAAFLGWQNLERHVPASPQPARFDLTLPQDMWVGWSRQAVAVSPSGDTIVMSLAKGEDSQLYLRALDDPALVPVPSTKSASSPFFSPDGDWIAFTQDGKLRKVSRDGGAAIDLCNTNWGVGAWLTDGRIIITDSYSSGLFMVPAGGGPKETLTEPAHGEGELGHWWPQLLPGDKWVIYTSWSTPVEKARIMAYSLENGEKRVLAEGGVFGRWSPSGHLLFVRGGKLLAAPFDLDKLAVTGVAEPVIDDVFLHPTDGYTNLSFGPDGTLIYVPASVMEPANQLVWVDREGKMTPLDVPARRYQKPQISPDGRRIAVTIYQNQNPDVWLHDLERGTWSRFTFSPTTDFNPHWTPDGRTVIYNGEEPQFTIYQRPADGSEDTRLLLKEPVDTGPTSISPDGKLLIFNTDVVGKSSDIMILALDGSAETRPFLSTRFREEDGVVSPDGNWLAYVNNESGEGQVYAMAFPDGGSRVQISIEGGETPIWSPLGDEIFFLDRSGLMVAAIDREKTNPKELAVDRPRRLMTGPFSNTNPNREFSITPDGKRFLTTHLPVESMPRRLRVVVNWFTELETVDGGER
jgi:Tol biopolymer transport system component